MTLTGRKGTVVIVALVASVCVNLLLGGMMVGHRWHGGWGGRMGPFGGSMMRGVPEEAQPLIKQVFDSNKADFDARRDAMEQSRKRIAELLQADTIDQAQLDAALGDLLQRTMELHQLGQKVMIDVAKQLPPDLRKEWAKKWADRPGFKH